MADFLIGFSSIFWLAIPMFAGAAWYQRRYKRRKRMSEESKGQGIGGESRIVSISFPGGGKAGAGIGGSGGMGDPHCGASGLKKELDAALAEITRLKEVEFGLRCDVAHRKGELEDLRAELAALKG